MAPATPSPMNDHPLLLPAYTALARAWSKVMPPLRGRDNRMAILRGMGRLVLLCSNLETRFFPNNACKRKSHTPFHPYQRDNASCWQQSSAESIRLAASSHESNGDGSETL